MKKRNILYNSDKENVLEKRGSAVEDRENKAVPDKKGRGFHIK